MTAEEVKMRPGEVVRVEKEKTEWETFVVVRFEEGEERFNAEAFPEKTRPGDKVRVGRSRRGVMVVEVED